MYFERLLIASLLLTGAATSSAHEIDPGGRIVVACLAQHAPRMADVARAVGDSHYWAPQSARKEMLALARQACDNGSSEAVFVPTADQRYAATRTASAKR